MDENEKNICNEDVHEESEDALNRIDEDYEDEEKSETHDVDPDINDIQGEDHDDNPQCTSTPERNIFLMLILNLVVSHVTKLKTVSYPPMFHFITCCFFLIWIICSITSPITSI